MRVSVPPARAAAGRQAPPQVVPPFSVASAPFPPAPTSPTFSLPLKMLQRMGGPRGFGVGNPCQRCALRFFCPSAGFFFFVSGTARGDNLACARCLG